MVLDWRLPRGSTDGNLSSPFFSTEVKSTYCTAGTSQNHVRLIFFFRLMPNAHNKMLPSRYMHSAWCFCYFENLLFIFHISPFSAVCDSSWLWRCCCCYWLRPRASLSPPDTPAILVTPCHNSLQKSVSQLLFKAYWSGSLLTAVYHPPQRLTPLIPSPKPLE